VDANRVCRTGSTCHANATLDDDPATDVVEGAATATSDVQCTCKVGRPPARPLEDYGRGLTVD
jgi:hypothetical protein